MDVIHFDRNPTSSSNTPFTPKLPTELWTRIFRLASELATVHTAYVPFCERPPVDRGLLRTIILVSRWWRTLALHLLYEDITIPSQKNTAAVDDLLKRLKRVEIFAKDPNGRYVRRLTLTSNRLDLDVAVLKCCPFVKAIIKPMTIKSDARQLIGRFPFPDPDIPSFDSLQRIEWSFLHNTPIFYNNNRESLIIFWHIMQITPNLLYLSLSGDSESWSHRHLSSPAAVFEQVRHLRILRTDRLDNEFLQDIANWNLPNLTHLITDRTVLIETIQAPRVRVVEALHVPTMPVRDDTMLRVLTSFPELQELNYVLGYLKVFEGHFTPNLRCVRLRSPQRMVTQTVIDHHMKWLCSPMVPSLRQVNLYGDWFDEELEMLRCWIPEFTARNCSMRVVE